MKVMELACRPRSGCGWTREGPGPREEPKVQKLLPERMLKYGQKFKEQDGVLRQEESEDKGLDDRRTKVTEVSCRCED